MLLRTILFSVIGNSFYKWFQKTKPGIWFDKKLDWMLSKIMRKEDVARSKAWKPKRKDKQKDMFEGEKYYDKYTAPRRHDGGPSK